MPKFIDLERVSVSDDAGNTVYLRRKMDMGALARVQAGTTPLLDLYVANILAWEGPDFKGIACTPENMARMDVQDDPFWNTVGDRIVALNPRLTNKAGDAGPLVSPPTTAGVMPSPASEPAPVDGTTST